MHPTKHAHSRQVRQKTGGHVHAPHKTCTHLARGAEIGVHIRCKVLKLCRCMETSCGQPGSCHCSLGVSKAGRGGDRLPLAAAPQLWCSQRSGLHQEAAKKEQLSVRWATGLRAACWRASELACGNHSSAPPARTRQLCAKANLPADAIASDCTPSYPARLPCGMQGWPAHLASNR